MRSPKKRFCGIHRKMRGGENKTSKIGELVQQHDIKDPLRSCRTSGICDIAPLSRGSSGVRGRPVHPAVAAGNGRQTISQPQYTYGKPRSWAWPTATIPDGTIWELPIRLEVSFL
jgi:hypothetical protein